MLLNIHVRQCTILGTKFNRIRLKNNDFKNVIALVYLLYCRTITNNDLPSCVKFTKQYVWYNVWKSLSVCYVSKNVNLCILFKFFCHHFCHVYVLFGHYRNVVLVKTVSNYTLCEYLLLFRNSLFTSEVPLRIKAFTETGVRHLIEYY